MRKRIGFPRAGRGSQVSRDAGECSFLVTTQSIGHGFQSNSTLKASKTKYPNLGKFGHKRKNHWSNAPAFPFGGVAAVNESPAAITSDRVFFDDPFGNDFPPPRFLIHHRIMNIALA